MHASRDIKAVVHVVLDGLMRREPESVVIEKLVAAGVPLAKAPAILRELKTACQQGVQSIITGGLSAPNGPPSDPMLAEAYRFGQARIRGAVWKHWLPRIVIFVLVAILAGVIVRFLRR